MENMNDNNVNQKKNIYIYQMEIWNCYILATVNIKKALLKKEKKREDKEIYNQIKYKIDSEW